MLIILFVSLISISLGSFINVLATRIPAGRTLYGRSICPNCDNQILWYDNIPIISFFILKGKCRKCNARISWVYPLVEIVTPIMVIIFTSQFESVALQVLAFITVVFGLTLTLIDVRFFRLPNSLTYSLALITILMLYIASTRENSYSSFYTSLICGFSLSIFFIILHFITHGGLGLGDAKYSFSVGLFAGYFGYLNLYVSIMLALFSGTLYGLATLFLRPNSYKPKIPFGPFLFLGLLLGYFLTSLISESDLYQRLIH